MGPLAPMAAALLTLGPAPAPPKTTICLATTLVESAPGKVSDVAEAVRAVFTEYLEGPSIDVVPLQSKLPSQVDREAREAGCPFVVHTTLKHVSKGGGGGLGGKLLGGAVHGGSWAAGSAISEAVGGTAGQVVGGAATGAANNVGYAAYYGSTKARDELTLGTRLKAADGTVLVDRNDKRKAASDGEDLLTPIVQKAADQIVQKVGER
ncbi:MAG TPA: hypothetical protein VFY20_14570 [Gemmatimonadales bacterium]|nr:hypothetical protein [Gemmatimonadales bacterium]